MKRYASLLGRILLSAIFIIAGLMKIFGWSGTAAYMASKGMPLIPLFLALTILVETGGGLALLVGFRARLAALALFLFLIPTTLIFHNFWALEGAARGAQQTNFLKNLAIMGGLLMVAAFGPGPLSLDRPEPRH